MTALYDTHIFLWAAYDQARVRGNARRELEQAPALLSAVVIWEISIKASLRRSWFDYDPDEALEKGVAAGWTELPISARHAAAVEDLPTVHGDPFDRLLVAQAVVEGVPLYTSDRALARYGDPVVLMR